MTEQQDSYTSIHPYIYYIYIHICTYTYIYIHKYTHTHTHTHTHTYIYREREVEMPKLLGQMAEGIKSLRRMNVLDIHRHRIPGKIASD